VRWTRTQASATGSVHTHHESNSLPGHCAFSATPARTASRTATDTRRGHSNSAHTCQRPGSCVAFGPSPSRLRLRRATRHSATRATPWTPCPLTAPATRYPAHDDITWAFHTTRRAQHSTAQHSTAQHSTAQHSTAQHSTAQHSTAQHSTAQHSTTQQLTPSPSGFTCGIAFRDASENCTSSASDGTLTPDAVLPPDGAPLPAAPAAAAACSRSRRSRFRLLRSFSFSFSASVIS
jgi:hypothetical protein